MPPLPLSGGESESLERLVGRAGKVRSRIRDLGTTVRDRTITVTGVLWKVGLVVLMVYTVVTLLGIQDSFLWNLIAASVFILLYWYVLRHVVSWFVWIVPVSIPGALIGAGWATLAGYEMASAALVGGFVSAVATGILVFGEPSRIDAGAIAGGLVTGTVAAGAGVTEPGTLAASIACGAALGSDVPTPFSHRVGWADG